MNESPHEMIKFEDTRFNDKREGAITFKECVFVIKEGGSEFTFFKWVVSSPTEQINTPLIFENNHMIGPGNTDLEFYLEGIQNMSVINCSFSRRAYLHLKNPSNTLIVNSIFDSHGINIYGKTDNVTIRGNIFTRFHDDNSHLDTYHAITYCPSTKVKLNIESNIFINFNFENKYFTKGAIGIEKCNSNTSIVDLSISIFKNDFSQLGSNQYAIINQNSLIVVNATHNFYRNQTTGPGHCCNPNGSENYIVGNVTFHPWCCNDDCDINCGSIDCSLCLPKHIDQMIVIIISTTIIVVLVLIGIMIIYCCTRKKHKHKYEIVPIESWSSKLLSNVENLQELFEKFNIKLIDYYDLNNIHPVPIGSGSFGEVYRGEWKNSMVAIKKISTTFTDQYDEIEQFLEEIKIMVSIDHPNLLSLKGLSIEPGSESLLLVTDLMEKGSLEDVLFRRKEKLDLDLKLSISADIAYGMHYLHSKDPGIVHRDLKPGNVLLSKKWTAKVSDFGIAKVLEHKAATLTIKGTPVYLAPECILKGKFSEKSDVFAYGITLTELYTEARAYENIEGGSNYLMLRIASEGLRPEITDNCPDDIKEMILDCLQDEPELRPSFTQILEKLSEIRVKNSLKYRK